MGLMSDAFCSAVVVVAVIGVVVVAVVVLRICSGHCRHAPSFLIVFHLSVCLPLYSVNWFKHQMPLINDN